MSVDSTIPFFRLILSRVHYLLFSERSPKDLRKVSERTPKDLRKISERSPKDLRKVSERTLPQHIEFFAIPLCANYA